MTLSQNILRIYSPKNCLKYSDKLKTIEDAIVTKSPCLAHFKKNISEDFTVSFLVVWLLYLNSLLNLKRPMTEDQIELCAGMIVKEYPALKITDLTFLFKKIIRGDFGSFYESLGIDKVLGFFNLYFEERLKTAEQISDSQHASFKNDLTFDYSTSLERLWYGSKGFNSKK